MEEEGTAAMKLWELGLTEMTLLDLMELVQSDEYPYTPDEGETNESQL